MAPEKKGEGEEDIGRLIPKFKGLSNEGKLELISYFINELKGLHEAAEHVIPGKKEVSIPAGVFGNDELSSLEAIVKYLKEELKLKFSKIGKLLNRSGKTIWATYHNSTRKMPSSFGMVSREIIIPISALSDRSYSTLESVVMFIKNLGYSNHEVALMLHLDDSTIWTVYAKVKKKRGVKG